MKYLALAMFIFWSATSFAGTVRFHPLSVHSGKIVNYEIKLNGSSKSASHILYVKSESGYYCRVPAENALGLDLISLGRVLLETNAELICMSSGNDHELATQVMLYSGSSVK